MALTQMLEIREGVILIDGVDLSTAPQPLIRTRLNTITQEPTFMYGSVRLNLDPQEQVNDDNALVDALQTVGLWNYVNSEGGLDLDMFGVLLSHGQRQLFCLARALCHAGCILIMDEPTSRYVQTTSSSDMFYEEWMLTFSSSVDDSETEERFDQIIERRFRDHTVISIIHKLHNIFQFDKVAVMENGRLAEYGSPHDLLARDGLFKQIYGSGVVNSDSSSDNSNV